MLPITVSHLYYSLPLNCYVIGLTLFYVRHQVFTRQFNYRGHSGSCGGDRHGVAQCCLQHGELRGVEVGSFIGLVDILCALEYEVIVPDI